MPTKTTYRSLIKEAALLTLKNKLLWVLGFWVAILGNGGEYEIFLGNLKRLRELSFSIESSLAFFTDNLVVKNLIHAIKNIIIGDNQFTNLGLLAILVGVVYLTIVSQGAMILGIYALKNRVKPLSMAELKDNTGSARAKFWELFFSTVLFRGSGFILAILISWPFIPLLTEMTELSFASSALLVGFLIFTPIAIVVSFLVKFTFMFILIKNHDPLKAFLESVGIVRTHWLVLIENALLLLGLNLVVGIITIISVLIISFPFVAALALSVYPLSLPEGHYVTIIALLSLFVGPLVGSMLATFQLSTWTLLFTTLSSRKTLQSKLVRVTNATLGKIV